MSRCIFAPAVGADSSADVVSLAYDSPPYRRALRAAEGLLWLLCLLSLLTTGRRHRRSRESRLLAAERLEQAEDATAEFGESLGFGADGPDDEEAELAVSFDIRPPVRAPVGGRSADRPVKRIGAGRVPSGSATLQKVDPLPAADKSTAEIEAAEGQATNAGDGRTLTPGDRSETLTDDSGDATMADALWESWSRRREERDDKTK